MDNTPPKTDRPEGDWEERARLLRTMAHPVRLMILAALAERPQCVRELNSLVPIVQAHLSQHMAALRKSGLVDCHVCGSLRCYYIIRPSLVEELLRVLGADHPSQPRSRESVMLASRQAHASRTDTN